MDRENTYYNNNKARDEVLNIMDEYSLKDIWRIRNEEKREFSWIKKNTYPTKASRIDLALISGGLDQYVEMVMYVSSVFTDHRALYLVVETSRNERGTGYWKMNTSLLQKKDFVQLINNEIDKTLESVQHKSPVEQWELLKERVKKCATIYARKNGSQDKLIISQLSEAVNNYEARLPLTREEDKLLEDTKVELEEKTMERIKGVMFRSKAKWYEEGERNTKYFYSLEKGQIQCQDLL